MNRNQALRSVGVWKELNLWSFVRDFFQFLIIHIFTFILSDKKQLHLASK